MKQRRLERRRVPEREKKRHLRNKSQVSRFSTSWAQNEGGKGGSEAYDTRPRARVLVLLRPWSQKGIRKQKERSFGILFYTFFQLLSIESHFDWCGLIALVLVLVQSYVLFLATLHWGAYMSGPVGDHRATPSSHRIATAPFQRRQKNLSNAFKLPSPIPYDHENVLDYDSMIYIQVVIKRISRWGMPIISPRFNVGVVVRLRLQWVHHPTSFEPAWTWRRNGSGDWS